MRTHPTTLIKFFIMQATKIKLLNVVVAAAAVIGGSLICSAQAKPINPINPEYMDCYTGLRNGALVDQNSGRPIMSAHCQDYSDGQYWTVGQYVRSR